MIGETKTLVLAFDKHQNVCLQYKPDALRISELIPSQTVPTIGGLTTFVANKNTVNSNITISATFTALSPPDTNDLRTQTAIVGGITTTLALANNIDNALKAYEATQSIISCANGYIDLISGMVKPQASTSPSVVFNKEALEKIKTLRSALRETDPCVVRWDIDEQTQPETSKYFIGNMDITAKTIQEQTGKTVVFTVDLVLVKQGNKILGIT